MVDYLVDATAGLTVERTAVELVVRKAVHWAGYSVENSVERLVHLKVVESGSTTVGLLVAVSVVLRADQTVDVKAAQKAVRWEMPLAVSLAVPSVQRRAASSVMRTVGLLAAATAASMAEMRVYE